MCTSRWWCNSPEGYQLPNGGIVGADRGRRCRRDNLDFRDVFRRWDKLRKVTGDAFGRLPGISQRPRDARVGKVYCGWYDSPPLINLSEACADEGSEKSPPTVRQIIGGDPKVTRVQVVRQVVSHLG